MCVITSAQHCPSHVLHNMGFEGGGVELLLNPWFSVPDFTIFFLKGNQLHYYCLHLNNPSPSIITKRIFIMIASSRISWQKMRQAGTEVETQWLYPKCPHHFSSNQFLAPCISTPWSCVCIYRALPYIGLENGDIYSYLPKPGCPSDEFGGAPCGTQIDNIRAAIRQDRESGFAKSCNPLLSCLIRTIWGWCQHFEKPGAPPIGGWELVQTRPTSDRWYNSTIVAND